MALSAPNTPRSNFATPRRLGARTPGPPETPECFNKVTVETPTSVSKRRSSKDKFDEVSNLTVAVRVRPMNSRELSCVGATNVVRAQNQELVVRSGSASTTVDHIFQYDHIFCSVDEDSPEYAGQEAVFAALGQPLLNSAFRGYNACLFAYGQTGSGKSYSMMGQNLYDAVDIDSDDHSGVTPRFCRELFERVSELSEGTMVSVEVSYFEIYNEKIHDLLAVNCTNSRVPLKVREHPEWGPYVVDLSVHTVTTYKELREWLFIGNKNRATAATAMNEKSSRSHCIFSIELCLSEEMEGSGASRRSKVSLVDLAGSERLGNSHNNEEKVRQGVSINKSLLTLGKVILALAEHKKNQFVPYRESVLTWLLRESLGGNSLTSMLATITPANTHIDETLATLRYACQARSIVNRARVNENPHDRLIRELKAEVERLRALRKDYERNSFSSIIQIDDSANHTQELEELREKLSHTESRLLEAQVSWEQRFMETKKNQMEELAAVEKRKEELESHVRVLEDLDLNVHVSPVRTNFLEEMDVLLNSECENVPFSNDLNRVKRLSWKAGLDLEFVGNADSTVTIFDNKTKKRAACSLNRLESLNNCKDLRVFYDKAVWVESKKRSRKISKSDIESSMKKIYEALSVLQPNAEDEEHLQLLFAKVNKVIQTFHSVLVNKSSGEPKTVTFNL